MLFTYMYNMHTGRNQHRESMVIRHSKEVSVPSDLAALWINATSLLCYINTKDESVIPVTFFLGPPKLKVLA